MSKLRIETDSLGSIEVPYSALWGAQTQRSLMNFQISSRKLPLPFIRALIEVKRACAIANIEFNVIPNKQAQAIIQVCDDILKEENISDQFPLDVYQTGSGTQTNMNANEVIANRAIKLLEGKIGSKDPVHPNDHVNKGQSSNDVIPTTMHVAALHEINFKLLPAIEQLVNALTNKQDEFMNIVKIGRTHLQDAVPLTLGQEFSAYVFQLKSAKQHIKETIAYLEDLAIGGTAVGTGLNAHPDLDTKVCEILSDRLGLNFQNKGNKFALIASKDSLVAVSGALRTLAIALLKIANDIRLLASGPRCGLGEISVPENEPGSSIMPGKINPTQSEMLVQVAAQVIGNDAAVSAGGQWGFLELNLMKPMIISNLLESVEILTNGMMSFTNNCVKGISANEDRIASLVEQSLMLVTGLTRYPAIGYDNASAIAKRAFKENKTIREIIEDEKILDEDELKKALDLSRMVNLDRMSP
jgi:fumarate hydratase class II